MSTPRWQIVLRSADGKAERFNHVGEGMLEKLLEKYPDLDPHVAINAGLALLMMKGQRED